MSFRATLLIVWLMSFGVGIWFTHRQIFGIRIPRWLQPFISPHVGAWLLWLSAAATILVGGLIAAYALVKLMHVLWPRMITN
jgi:hypothetical protein